MKGCPYDTDGDGNCYLCVKPGWHCNGERPEQDETGKPMRSMVVTWSDHGTYTVTPSTEEANLEPGQVAMLIEGFDAGTEGEHP